MYPSASFWNSLERLKLSGVTFNLIFFSTFKSDFDLMEERLIVAFRGNTYPLESSESSSERTEELSPGFFHCIEAVIDR